MGRGSKASLEGDEAPDLSAIRQQLRETRKETEDLRLEVNTIKADVRTMNLKQDEVVDVVSEMNSAIGKISTQLTAMSGAINSLRTPNISAERAQQKSPTFQQSQQQQGGQLTEELKKRLLLEQEKTKILDMMTMNKLHPIETGRRSAPPGFAGPSRSLAPTPKQASTPVFHTFGQEHHKLQQLWEGYARDYEKEMRMQFFKSITKGPRMDFPRFDGDNPVGWIRQCEKYFQMAAAPEEYKVHLAQLYFVGSADVWLRRSGLHKQQLSWTQFAEEVVHRFSGSSTYELAEKFNTIRQNNSTVKEYT